MNPFAILLDSVWSGFFAGSIGIILTAPPRYIVPTFFCGFAGRLVRTVLTGWGLGQGWATVVAAATVVLVGVTIIRRHVAAPVVLISAVLPLGPSLSLFNVIMDLMKAASFQGNDLSTLSVSLTANAGKLFIQSLAIALGLAAGIAIARLIRGEDLWESA